MANPNIAKLKKKAADFEQKKQFDRALSLYIQLLEEAGRDLDDADLQLFNRVGDLLQRQGNVSEALAYYEKAVDVYAERGFLNNAIALCNKILRQSPARTSVYYKLGKISATKGFKSDAKKNFLEYAERMQKSGHIDEAFRALKEFADLCPDQDDIRLMLADWLQKENRKSEAVQQLETLYIKLEEEGREAEARATIDRIKAIDPTVVPRPSGSFQTVKSNDLVFLDLDDAEQVTPRHAATPAAGTPASAAPSTPKIAALDGLILTFDPDVDDASALTPVAVDGFESTSARDAQDDEPLASLIVDFEDGGDETSHVDSSMPSLLTMEGASWTDPADPVPHVDGLESPRTSLVGAHPSMAPLIDVPPMSGEEFAGLRLSHNDGVIEPSHAAHKAHDLALPSDLPILPAEAPIDLLRVMGTPLGTPVVADGTDEIPSSTIDLLSLPPVGEILDSSSLEWPVEGSETPIDLGAADPRANDHHEADATRDPAVDDATAEPSATNAPAFGEAAAQELTQRRSLHDTAELLAQDGTARKTDELLVVPSEDIDEETRRSLRLEFSLDGEETPDSWIEAALSAPDDRSLDLLLTPLYTAAIPEPSVEVDATPPGEPTKATNWSDDASGDAGSLFEATAAAMDAATEMPYEAGENVENAWSGDVASASGDDSEIETRADVDAVSDEQIPLPAIAADVRESNSGVGDADPSVADTHPGPAEVTAGSAGPSELADLAAPPHVDVSLDPTPVAGQWQPIEAHESTGAIEPSSDRSDSAIDAVVPAESNALTVPSEGGQTEDSDSAPTLELLAIPESLRDAPDESAAVAHEEFDLLDELLPPFMRHDVAATRAADVAEREALSQSALAASRGAQDAAANDRSLKEDVGAHMESMESVGEAQDGASALDVDALRALMLDRGIEGSGAMTHAPTFDDPTLSLAFQDHDVPLPLLDVDDLLPRGSDELFAPLDLSEVVADDILGTPPSFGEGSSQEFVPDPLFSVDNGEEREEETPVEDAPAIPPAASDDWSQDASPEVLIDGEWHDEHMGDLLSGEIAAVRPDGDAVPPRSTPRWDDLAAALMWPSSDDDEGGDAPTTAESTAAATPLPPELAGTPPRDSFIDRLHTPRSTLSFGGVEAQLRRRLELDPENPILRRQLGEALLDQGDRDDGLRELELAMAAFEQLGDLESARGVADIVLRVVPASVRHHQKRVEYAVRSNDRVRLVEAYVELADSLFRSGEPDKARVVYSRVLELSPGNGRARFALGLLSDEERTVHSARIATPPPLPPLPPTPADMVSLFDRAIPRTPVEPLSSISAEIPVIADGLFLASADAAAGEEATAALPDTASDITVQDVLDLERSVRGSEEALADGEGGVPNADPTAAEASAESSAESEVVSAADVVATEADASGVATELGSFSLPPERGDELPEDVSHAGHEAIEASIVESVVDGAESAEHVGESATEGDESATRGGQSATDGDESATYGGESAMHGDDEGVDGVDGVDGVEDVEDIEDATLPFPAPTLDDQIDAAFAVPPLVEVERPSSDDAPINALDLHDVSVTPALGAAAFATPFSSSAPQSPSITPRGLPPVLNSPFDAPGVTQPPDAVWPVQPTTGSVAGGSDDDFVDLGSWLRDEEPVRSTRMVTSEAPPSGDEQADFDEMLRRFKQGVAANVDEEDYASHYDLGVAYKEMGLVDEAIAEFQKSLRGDSHRVRSYEALGQCFVEKGQLQVAIALLRRATETTGADDQQLVGVLYLLGYASEVMARHADAVSYYQRVFAVDIEFRDVAQRVAAIEQKTQ